MQRPLPLAFLVSKLQFIRRAGNLAVSVLSRHHDVVSAGSLGVDVEFFLQSPQNNFVVHGFEVVLLELNRVDEAEDRVAQILVDTAATGLTTSQDHAILLQLLDSALFPWILMLADDDGGRVAP